MRSSVLLGWGGAGRFKLVVLKIYVKFFFFGRGEGSGDKSWSS